MTIEYRQTRDFTEKDLRRLFLSVGWESGRYPKRLVTAMRNSTHVISAWDGDRLIGLVRALDDGATIAFLVDPKYQGRHIGDELMKRIMKNFTDLLHVKVIPSDPRTDCGSEELIGTLHVKVIPSDPRTIMFYERYGFRQYDNCPAMVKKNMQDKDLSGDAGICLPAERTGKVLQ